MVLTLHPHLRLPRLFSVLVRFAVVLLLSMFGRFYVLSLFYDDVVSVLSNLAIISPRKIESWLLYSLLCSFCREVSVPRGVMGQVWCLIVSIPDLCTLTYFRSSRCCGLVAQGDTLIFSYIRGIESFLGVQNFEFQYFLGGFQKNKYFLGYEDFVDIFWGCHKKWTIFRGHFYAF